MQVIRTFPILAMFILPFLSGCTHDDDYSGGYSDVSVQFTAQSSGASSTSAWQQMNVPIDNSSSGTLPSSSSISTRGITVSDTDVPAGNAGVLGYILTGGTWSSSLSPSFMYDTPLTRQGTGSSYTYQYAPHKYWPSNTADLVKFFAYSPYQGDGITLSGSSVAGYPSITYTPSATVGDQADLMVASPSACNHSSGLNAVDLSFSHTLTRVSFSVENVTSYNTVTVQSISLTGVKNKGTFSYDPSVASAPWTLSSSASDTITYKVSTSDGTLIPEASQALNSSAYQNITSYTGYLLLLPQSVTSANKLVVKYTIDGVSKVSTLSLPSTTWAMGQSINYQLKLGLANANCYIVNPSAGSAVTLDIPITRVNEFWGNAFLGNNTSYVIGTDDAWTANIIWEDVPGLLSLSQSSGKGPSDNIKVNVPAGSASGNALIGIKKAGTTGYAWSWHVWVTGYNPNTANSSICGSTFMNYDLGTTDTVPGNGYKGLYYQWGRKDPFPQAASVNSNTVEQLYGTVINTTTAPVPIVTSNLNNAVHNPTVFYIPSDSDSYDWYTNASYSQNDNLWGNLKTIYDPCPAGWKVPNSTPYASFVNGSMNNEVATHYGWTDKFAGTFWSLSGGMNRTNGSLTAIGTGGYVWTSSHVLTYAYNLTMSTNFVIQNATYRSSGFHVRCVEDK